MKMKSLVITILLMLASFAIASAQSPNAGAVARRDGDSSRERESAKPASETPAPVKPPEGGTPNVPQLKPEDLLKIRDLQYTQARRALRMAAMEAEYKTLNEAQTADAKRIDDVVGEAAGAAGIDRAKWTFDTDALKFVSRPESQKSEARDQRPAKDPKSPASSPKPQ